MLLFNFNGGVFLDAIRRVRDDCGNAAFFHARHVLKTIGVDIMVHGLLILFCIRDVAKNIGNIALKMSTNSNDFQRNPYENCGKFHFVAGGD